MLTSDDQLLISMDAFWYLSIPGPSRWFLNAVQSNCTDSLDLLRLMIGIVKTEVPVMIYMFGIYFISIIYTLLLESWTINILIMCFNIVLNAKRLTNDQATYSVSVRQEKIKILLTVAVFTIRFFCFSTSKIVFIPTFMIFSISGNKLNGSVLGFVSNILHTISVCRLLCYVHNH